ncbi:hypothetical protein SEA_PHARAOH_61 [Mycobacterium phage Pharaoh]|uniref:Lipoprotein n=1 Tax=Mycobacterium phage Pharaoh TaxID=2530140 RepID=A0A481W3B1_9CAUD|nr:hypothetical protein KIV59_gp29 [Mycobacterium phage Pharaoh]QBJ00249.1 hypothetical protein SEA_PHARAOH_61 [Mycobacterium phage Pharaoh]
MKKLALALVAPMILIAMLTGCGASTVPGGTVQSSDKAVSANPHYVNLPDGRKVLCVYEGNANDGRSGGPSCDWDHAG